MPTFPEKTGTRGLSLRGKVYWSDIQVNGVRIRESLKTKNETEAKNKLSFLRERYSRLNEIDLSKAVNYVPRKSLVLKLLIGIKERSKIKGFSHTFTESDVEMILVRSAGYCELTGIEFTDDRSYAGRRAPFAPSIDRIDSRKPYTVKNCRVICVAANVALSDWGEAVFKKLAEAYCLKNYTF